MKKKLLVASLSILGAVALVSCDEKEKNNSNSDNSKYADIDLDELDKASLSLRDIAIIDDAYTKLDFTSVEGYNYYYELEYYYGQKMDYSKKESIDANVYSNDVYKVHKEIDYTGTSSSSYPMGPVLAAPSTTPSLSLTSLSVSSGVKKVKVGPMYENYVVDEIYAFTNNYVYDLENKEYEGYCSYPTYNVFKKDKTDSALEYLKDDIDFPSTFYASQFKTYKLDSTHYLFKLNYDYTYNDSISKTIDGENTNVKIKERDVRDVTAVISYKNNEAKLDYSYTKYEKYSTCMYDDYYDDYVLFDDELVLIEKEEAEYEYGYKENNYDKKMNFISDFGSYITCNDVYTEKYDLTFDSDNNVTGAVSKGSSSYQNFDELKIEKDSFTYDIQFELYKGNYYALVLDVVESEIIDKVLIDDELVADGEDFIVSNRTSLKLDVDLSDIDDENLKIYNYDDVSYLYYDGESSSYPGALFLKVKVSYDSKNDTYKTEISDQQFLAQVSDYGKVSLVKF